MSTPVCLSAKQTLLEICDWCGGAGFEPDEEGASIDCGICDGGGYSPIVGQLSPTKTYKKRSYHWNAGKRLLAIFRNNKRQDYRVREYRPDALEEFPEARAFEFERLDTHACYYLLSTRAGLSCDCAGREWETSAKANARSYCAGGEMHDTLGCIHSDWLKEALAFGMLDLPDRPALVVTQTAAA